MLSKNSLNHPDFNLQISALLKIVNGVFDHLGSDNFSFKMLQSSLYSFNSLLKELFSFLSDKYSSFVSITNVHNVMFDQMTEFLWPNAEYFTNLFRFSFLFKSHHKNLMNVT